MIISIKKKLAQIKEDVKEIYKLLTDTSTDPVYHCDVYLDKKNGSCSHVDGFLCDFPDCSILKNYRELKNINNG